jgi:ABC-type branched-subunit amino acid transport system substrate-binding protein
MEKLTEQQLAGIMKLSRGYAERADAILRSPHFQRIVAHLRAAAAEAYRQKQAAEQMLRR